MSEPKYVPDLTPAELAAMPLTCDTCHAECGELWTFLHSAFVIDGRDAAGAPLRAKCDAGEWGACDECAAAIAAGDLDTLVARAIAANPGANKNTRDLLRLLQARFLAHVKRDSADRATSRADMRVQPA